VLSQCDKRATCWLTIDAEFVTQFRSRQTRAKLGEMEWHNITSNENVLSSK